MTSCNMEERVARALHAEAQAIVAIKRPDAVLPSYEKDDEDAVAFFTCLARVALATINSTPYSNALRESRCTIPPEGWWCSRTGGHEGPCAARAINPASVLCDELRKRFDDEPDFLGIEASHVIEMWGEAIQRIHRYALAAEGVGYDLILSVTDPLVNSEYGDAALLSSDPGRVE